MLKALLKKQLLELCAMWFRDRKTGKMRSGKSLAGAVCLWVFLFGSLGVSFFGMSMLLAPSFLSGRIDWLYFAVMGGIALGLGVFGDVFNSYSALYMSKDNELLLSLPIKPSYILFSRMTGVYLMGLLYESIVFIPAVLVYWLNTELTAAKIVFPVICLLFIALLVLSLTCILGYAVAALSKKMQGKSLVTVGIALVFIAGYYFVSFKMSAFLQKMAENAEKIGADIKSYIYPLYVLGNACVGDIKSFIITVITVSVVTLAVYFVLSKSFIKILTSNDTKKKSKAKKISSGKNSVSSALLKREFAHLLSSPTYMLNCGLGLVILLFVAVMAVIKRDFIQMYIDVILYETPDYYSFFAPAVTAAVAVILAANNFTAPSISIEGKNLWILKSLPVSAGEVLKAKEKMHIILTSIPAVLCTAVLSFVMGLDIFSAVGAVLFVFIYCVFTADMGLIMNLKRPDLVWINENVPIKQSMSVLFTMLINFALCVVFAACAIAASFIMPAYYVIYIFVVILALIVLFLKKWLGKKGTEIFENL